ncbi:MAG: type I-B CRISPR-associated protein Cas7/Cst2/DevR [Cytophagales bacterium]|nr:type I-B CRISPR-associated protein Cas7/Cst2/DevR [Cytophagales bacterium]
MSNQTKKVNCLNIAYIFKTSLGSINGSWTEGNVSTVKKITLPDGNQLPYVSGQSLKYQIKKGWREMGETLSEVKATENAKGVDVSLGEPYNYIDDDLFGFMIATTGENRRRTAPVRCSAAIGVFPYQGDRDLGTKSKEKTGEDMGSGGNIFETEIYYNYFKVNILVELDRIGNFQEFELESTQKKDIQNLSIEKRRARVINFLKSLSNVWGGGKQSRILTDMSPKFLAITFQNVKSPIFLEGLNVSKSEVLDTKTINQILSDHSETIEKQILGLRSGIFKNENIDLEGVESIQTAFDSAIDYIDKLEF